MMCWRGFVVGPSLPRCTRQGSSRPVAQPSPERRHRFRGERWKLEKKENLENLVLQWKVGATGFAAQTWPGKACRLAQRRHAVDCKTDNNVAAHSSSLLCRLVELPRIGFVSVDMNTTHAPDNFVCQCSRLSAVAHRKYPCNIKEFVKQ